MWPSHHKKWGATVTKGDAPQLFNPGAMRGQGNKAKEPVETKGTCITCYDQDCYEDRLRTGKSRNGCGLWSGGDI